MILSRPVAAVALNVGGAICDDTTWHQGDSPIVVTSGLFIGGATFCSGKPPPTLTIEAGVVVRFASSKLLDVFGTLVARGTADAPIRFTSNSATPAPGDWLGIRFEDSSPDATFDGTSAYSGGAILEYCVIEYAKDTGGSGVVDAASSSPFLKDVTVQKSNPTFAVYFGSGTGNVRMQNVAVMSSTCSYGIYVNGGLVDLMGLNVSNNTLTYGVYVASARVNLAGLDVSNNALNGSGLYVTANNGGSTLGQLNITGNTGGGTGLSPSGSSPILISNATISGNGGVGVSGANMTLQQSTITDNGGAGVSVGNSTLTGLLVSGNGGAGIETYGSSISGSCVSANQGPTLHVDYVGTTTVRQSTLVNDSSDGTLVDAAYAPAVDIQQSNLIHTGPGGQAGPFVLRDNEGAGAVPVVASHNWWGTSDAGEVEDTHLSLPRRWDVWMRANLAPGERSGCRRSRHRRLQGRGPDDRHDHDHLDHDDDVQ